MRVAALYDIHGNLPALEAVLDEVRRAGVERIVVGGDVLPGPMPKEALACLRALGIPAEFIRGNGEDAVLAVRAGREPVGGPEAYRGPLNWVAEQLDPDDVRWLSSWPNTIQVEISGPGGVLFCHATPRNHTEIFTRLTPNERVQPAFAGVTAPVAVCGHTHMQFDRRVGGIRVVNAGSVGMPFGESGAFWLLLGPGVELRHTRYDLAAAAERIRGTAYPQADAFAAQDLLRPRSEREMLEVFTRAEMR